MKVQFYIHTNGQAEGPFDLLTLMKRIKNGKVTAQTLVSTEPASAPIPAGHLPDLAMFFDRDTAPEPAKAVRPKYSLSQMLRTGWRFVSMYQTMSVFAGAIVLFSFMLAILLNDFFGIGVAVMVSSMVFFTLQSVFLICALRLNRGQHINTEFLDQAVFAHLIPLLFGSCLLAVLFWVGAAFFVIPGVVLFSIYAFVPFLIADRGYGVIEAMEASRMLISRNHSAYFGAILGIVALHLLACGTILLIPLTLPILAGPLAELYDELSYKQTN